MNSVERRYAGARGATGAGLVADRPLDHLHVAVAPLLEALVEVDEALADLGRAAVGDVHGEQHVVELRGAAGGDGDVALEHRRRHGEAVAGEVAQERVVQRAVGAWPPRAGGGRAGIGVRRQDGRVASTEHDLELAELGRLEAARGVEPAAEAGELARASSSPARRSGRRRP